MDTLKKKYFVLCLCDKDSAECSSLLFKAGIQELVVDLRMRLHVKT